jgi:hypothetical protein
MRFENGATRESPMMEHGFGSQGRLQDRKVHREEDGTIHYLLRAEEQLLQLISTREPLPKLLNEICNALDRQVGNVISLISPRGEDENELAPIAKSAAVFGLHAFCSESVVAGNDELLGFLEMYCSVPRGPTASEREWIERAKCLAAIAIKRHEEEGQESISNVRKGRAARGRVIQWPKAIR